jgi:hypothetical protein
MTRTFPLQPTRSHLLRPLGVVRLHGRLGQAARGIRFLRSRVVEWLQDLWLRLVLRLIGVVGGTAGGVLVSAGPAAAMTLTLDPPGTPRHPLASGMLQAFDAKGASGISITQYELSLDHGGFTSPIKGVLASLVETLWESYRIAVGIAVWLYEQASGFGWLKLILPPAEAFVGLVHEMMALSGLEPVLITVAAFLVGVMLLRGQWGRGLAQLLISCTLATLALGGALSNPVDTIAGPNGMLPGAQQLGVEFSAAVASGGHVQEGDEEQLRAKTSGALVDAFMRGPHQLINFGHVLDDDPACRKVYDDTLKGGPRGSDDNTLRDAVKECDEAAGEWAANPSGAQVGSMIALVPSGGLLLLTLIVLTGLLLAASMLVVWESARLLVALIQGILPGGARHGAAQSIASIAMGLVLVTGALTLVGVYVLALSSLMQPQEGQARDPSALFVTVDLLLVVGLFMLLMWWSRARASARRWAERLSELVGGESVSSSPSRLAPMALAGFGMTRMRRQVAKGMRNSNHGPAQHAGAAGNGAAAAAADAPAAGAAQAPQAPAAAARRPRGSSSVGHRVPGPRTARSAPPSPRRQAPDSFSPSGALTSRLNSTGSRRTAKLAGRVVVAGAMTASGMPTAGLRAARKPAGKAAAARNTALRAQLAGPTQNIRQRQVQNAARAARISKLAAAQQERREAVSRELLNPVRTRMARTARQAEREGARAAAAATRTGGKPPGGEQPGRAS